MMYVSSISKLTQVILKFSLIVVSLTLSRPHLFRFLENNPNLDVIK